MWLLNCVTTIAIIAVTSSYCDIMRESIPGSSLLFFVGVRGEAGNKARVLYSEGHFLSHEWVIHKVESSNQTAECIELSFCFTASQLLHLKLTKG